jgi:hypothetical protein
LEQKPDKGDPTMNPKDGVKLSGGADRQFDLLVDGELGEEDRRALLSGLDGEPGGWRRCALAFLEAQAWKREFATLLRPGEPPAASPRPTASPRSAKSSWWSSPAGTVLAMAGSFLIALVLGVHWNNGGAWNSPGLAAVAAKPWQMVTLTAADGRGNPQTFQLPAVQADRLDGAWLRSIPKPVSADLLQAFQDSGHHVDQRRELVPVEMKDGRRLVVPVDQVNIRYVGRSAL